MTRLEADLVRLYRERKIDLQNAGQNQRSQETADLIRREWYLIRDLLLHHGINPDVESPNEPPEAKSRSVKV